MRELDTMRQKRVFTKTVIRVRFPDRGKGSVEDCTVHSELIVYVKLYCRRISILLKK